MFNYNAEILCEYPTIDFEKYAKEDDSKKEKKSKKKGDFGTIDSTEDKLNSSKESLPSATSPATMFLQL